MAPRLPHVDSYRFLPRSFRPLFESPVPLPGEAEPVWSPFESRLADATIALLSSAGLSVAGEQAPFDAEGERARPSWGDPTWRAIPRATTQGQLEMTHLHVNPADVSWTTKSRSHCGPSTTSSPNVSWARQRQHTSR